MRFSSCFSRLPCLKFQRPSLVHFIAMPKDRKSKIPPSRAGLFVRVVFFFMGSRHSRFDLYRWDHGHMKPHESELLHHILTGGEQLRMDQF